MATNREGAIIVLNRLGTTSAEATNAMNVLLDLLNTIGYADVANAFMTRLNATSTILQSSLNPAIVAATQNLNYSMRTNNDRL